MPKLDRLVLVPAAVFLLAACSHEAPKPTDAANSAELFLPDADFAKVFFYATYDMPDADFTFDEARR
jgi:hypothetical protein